MFKSLFSTISIASDHAGYELKEFLKNYLINNNVSTIDLGPFEKKSVDYPDYAKKVANRVSSKKSEVGILVCGSGIGMSIAANKSNKVRAALCNDLKSSSLSRQHNNANIITMGARMLSKDKAVKIIKKFLTTKFDGGRHLRRIKKIK